MHALSPRASGPFVKVNCAAVPLEMWESEFFGHRKGSFPGATSDRDGRFQLADKGTLFLDEVGTMPSAGQAKLLRAIQDGEFERLGDEQPTRSDVRCGLDQRRPRGRGPAGPLPRDLFYSLNVVRIEVPPLRERRDDIRSSPATSPTGSPSASAPHAGHPPAVLARLGAYPWPATCGSCARDRARDDPRPGARARRPRPRPGQRRGAGAGGD